MNQASPMEQMIKPIAACGLYCGACGKFTKGKCPGCRDNEKASWCAIRTCCVEHDYASCADCVDFTDPKACGKFNHFIGKLVGVLLNSDRAACIRRIREVGHDAFAVEMDAKGAYTLKKRGGKSN